MVVFCIKVQLDHKSQGHILKLNTVWKSLVCRCLVILENEYQFSMHNFFKAILIEKMKFTCIIWLHNFQTWDKIPIRMHLNWILFLFFQQNKLASICRSFKFSNTTKSFKLKWFHLYYTVITVFILHTSKIYIFCGYDENHFWFDENLSSAFYEVSFLLIFQLCVDVSCPMMYE